MPSPLPSLPPSRIAAYAGHTALNLLFPWRFARLDKALKALNLTLTSKPAQLGAAESLGRAAATKT